VGEFEGCNFESVNLYLAIQLKTVFVLQFSCDKVQSKPISHVRKIKIGTERVRVGFGNMMAKNE